MRQTSKPSQLVLVKVKNRQWVRAKSKRIPFWPVISSHKLARVTMNEDFDRLCETAISSETAKARLKES